MGVAAAATVVVGVIVLRPSDEDIQAVGGGREVSVTTSTAIPLPTLDSATGPSSSSVDSPVDASESPDSTEGVVSVGPPPSTGTTLETAETTTTPTTSPSYSALSWDREVEVSVGDLPETLSLSADGYLDWVITGSRRDGKLISLDHRDPSIDVRVLHGPVQWTAAPIDIVWTDGQPEEDRVENGHWWSTPADPMAWASYEVRIDGAEAPSEIELYVGGSHEVTVTVVVDGFGVYSTELDPSPDGSGAAGVVKIDLAPTTRGHGVSILLGGHPGTAFVSLGAVTVR